MELKDVVMDICLNSKGGNHPTSSYTFVHSWLFTNNEFINLIEFRFTSPTPLRQARGRLRLGKIVFN